MNSNSGNSRQYSAEDIRRYVQGEMSSAEMHGIERAALDDPFLSDAIDGYSESITAAGSPLVEDGRNTLQKEFEERIKDSKRQVPPVIRMKWWQAAAAAAVIVSAGVLSYNSWKDGEPGASVVSANETIQQTTPAPVQDVRDVQLNDSVNRLMQSDSIAGNNPSGVLSVPEKNQKPALSEAPLAMNRADSARAKMEQKAFSSETPDAATAVKNARRSPNSPAQSAPVKPAEDDRRAERELAKSTDELAAMNESASVVKQKTVSVTMPEKDQAPDKMLQGKAAGVEITKAQAKKQANANASLENKELAKQINYFQGQVLSNDNKPLSNAILKLADQKKAYSTDNNGNFFIPSIDSVISFDVTMVGKNPTRFTLNNTSGYSQLILPDAENEMSEVVVVGYGAQKKRSRNGAADVFKPSSINAVPVTGWPALQEYFEKNKNKNLNITPDQPTDVHFRVGKNGTLSGFKVTRSISPEHDKEAIRLVQQGPAWKLTKGRKADITVTIIF